MASTKPEGTAWTKGTRCVSTYVFSEMENCVLSLFRSTPKRDRRDRPEGTEGTEGTDRGVEGTANLFILLPLEFLSLLSMPSTPKNKIGGIKQECRKTRNLTRTNRAASIALTGIHSGTGTQTLNRKKIRFLANAGDMRPDQLCRSLTQLTALLESTGRSGGSIPNTITTAVSGSTTKAKWRRGPRSTEYLTLIRDLLSSPTSLRGAASQ